MKTLLIKLMLLGYVFCLQPLALIEQEQQAKMFLQYEFHHLADTNHREEPIIKPMYLYLSETASYYTSIPLKASKDQGAISFSLDQSSQSDALINWYQDLEDHTNQWIIGFIGKPYKIKPEHQSQIDWTITDQTKQIGGYNCQKATGHFAGRDYTAWFTSEVPFSVGPWKLSGLPGAILEAEDLSGEVKFLYAGLNTLEDKIAFIPFDKLEELPYSKYKKALKNSEKDTMGALLASLPPGANVEFKTEDGRTITADEAEALMEQADQQSTSINNPAERWENQ